MPGAGLHRAVAIVQRTGWWYAPWIRQSMAERSEGG